MSGEDSELIALKSRISEMEKRRQELEKRLERSLADQNRLEERVRLIEDTPSFRVMRAVGRFLGTQKRRLGQIVLHSPLCRYYLRPIHSTTAANQYAAWVEDERLATPPLESLRTISDKWLLQPCVSVLMPIRNPRREWLQAAVDSVLAQSYEKWQLCLCEDSSSEGWVSEYLCCLVKSDKRFQYVRSPGSSGISAMLNQAGNLARGEYIGFLGHDEALSPRALHAVVEALQSGPVDIVYSDEDSIDPDGHRVRPNFKPAWSPELLLNCMYLGRFLVASKASVERVGWFRSEFDGAHDYDLALRITDRNPQVRHVPEILYHRRQAGSSAAESLTPHAASAALRSLSDAVERRGWNAQVRPGTLANTYWVRREMERYPSVSVIVCSRNSKLLMRCLASLRESTRYPDWKVVVVQHTFGGDPNLPKVVAASKCASVPYAGQFNFSRMNNLGAAASKGDVLIFLNDDVEPIRHDWMTCMAAQLAREEVGVVGACLLYPSGMLQHAGVVAPAGDAAGHPGRGLPPDGCELWPWLSLTRNVTAVTGACLGIRRTVFERLGGMDTAFPNNYNDVDLCLRAAREGFMTIYESRALLRHKECATRAPGTGFDERELFHARWGDLLSAGDPYYSPSLRTDTEAVMLRFPADTSGGSVNGRRAASLPE